MSKKIIKAAFCAIGLAGICLMTVIMSCPLLREGRFEGVSAAGIILYFIFGIFMFMAAVVYSEGLFGLSSRHRAALYIFTVLATALMISISTYQPCNDSNELHTMLYRALNNIPADRTDIYRKTYLGFYSSNKLTYMIYLVFVRLFSDVKTGVRVLNGICVYAAVFCVCRAVKNLFGERAQTAALLLMPFLAPVMIMSGPYIYPISVMLSSLCIMLISEKKLVSRVLFLPAAGMLYSLRLSAFVPVMVFAVFILIENIKSFKQFIKKAVCILVIAATAISVKGGIALLMYKTGAHTYPGLEDGAALWTLEVGTRPNDNYLAGLCSYSPGTLSEDVGSDEIAQDINALWKLYVKNDPSDAAAIRAAKKELAGKLVLRYTETLKDPVLFFSFMKHKLINFYGNVYQPYYKRTSIMEGSFGKSFYKNVAFRDFLYENMIYFLFFVSLFVTPWILKRRQVYAVIAVLAQSAVFLMLTEVSKKYMFDFLPEMLIVIICAVSGLGCVLSGIKKEYLYAVRGIVALVTAASVIIVDKSATMINFKNSKYSVRDMGESYVITFYLEEKYGDEDCYITDSGGRVFNIKNRSAFSLSCPKEEVNAFFVEKPGKSAEYISAQVIP
ncbi:MAG: hypothetical protein IJH37_00590 [Clostridia bacterium]|nr:hypothetical protein [Clostridia bacterium]